MVYAHVPNNLMFGGKDMNIYTTDKIRNVAILGHCGCVKTILTEDMAYLAVLTSRM